MPRELREMGGYSPSTRAANGDEGGDFIEDEDAAEEVEVEGVAVSRCWGANDEEGVRKLLR